MLKTITIMWEGPISYDKARSEYYLDNHDRCDFGLYQIYGPHDLYSNKKRPAAINILLYIGKTVSGSTFSGRISAHGFCHLPEYEIYLGRIEDLKYVDDIHSWECDVGDAEQILINKYAPPYNGNFTGDLRRDQLNSPDCSVINLGAKVDLDEEIKSEDVVYIQK